MSPENLFVGFVIIFIASVIGFFWLLRQLWLTLQRTQDILRDGIAEEIQQGLQPFVVEMEQVKSSLNDSKQQLEETTAKLQNVGTNFENSHSHFQDAIVTLAEPGTLQNFTNTLTESIHPLHDIRDGINDHYQANAQLQRTVSQILQQWLIQQTKVRKDFELIAEVLKRWSTEEEYSRREMTSKTVDHLKMVTQQSQTVADNMREMQGEIYRLAKETSTLKGTMKDTVNSVSSLVGLQNRVAKSQQLYLTDLKTIADSLAQNYTQVSMQLNATLEKSNHILGQYEQTVQEFHGRHGDILTKLEAQHDRLTNEQNRLLEKAHRVIGNLPTKQAQVWQIALLIMLVLPVIYITYLILSSM